MFEMLDFFLTLLFSIQAKETELMGWNKVVNEAKSKVCVQACLNLILNTTDL